MTEPDATAAVPDDFVDLAVALAAAAAPVAMRYFRGDIDIDIKADLSPVTAADREAEEAMRGLIEATFPDHGIIGEEHGKIRAAAEFVWVLDPIDGTQSFVTGKPLFGTLIGLVKNGVPVIGVIDMPALKERWIGVHGRQTTFNGKPVWARACERLDQAWLYATSPQMFPEGDFQAFENLRKHSRRAIYGADCYAYGLLANGTVDLVAESTMQPYDYVALVPVVAGAGGVITDWRGNELTIRSDGRVLAAGDKHIHKAALKALKI
jgi:inositol-phosphate phosphatase/L-galactose 1-phosphate phosphatase/histidinol-phosphatase